MNDLSSDLEIINKILHHRLQRDDIQEILSQLSDRDQSIFAEKVGQVLKRTSLLLEVSRRVNENLELDVMLPKMVMLISEFLNAERATIFLHESEHRELFSRVALGDLNFEIRLPDHQGLVGACHRSGESLMINDPYRDPRFDPSTDRRSGFVTRNVLCVPIKHRGQGIGVVQVLNRIGGPFDTESLMSLEAIAQHTSIGFENARLYDQVMRARAQEQRLFDVTTAISQELQLKPLLIKVMETVTSFLGADRSTLFLYDQHRDELWSQVAQGTSEIRFPSHLGIAGSVFKSGETVNITDAYRDGRFNPEFDLKSGYRTRTILCMPVTNKSGVTIGVIQVINKLEGVFTSQDERSLSAFSAQASIAIENAKLFEQVVEVKRYNEAVLQSMASGVLTLDARGDLITANRVATSLLGGPSVVQALYPASSEFQLGEGVVESDLTSAALTPRDFMSLCRAHLPWLADIVDRVQSEGEQIHSLDHPLTLTALAREATGDPRLEVAERSVNVTAVPLIGASDAEAGTLVLLEDMSQEKRLRATMTRYVPPEVADQLMRDGGEALGGSLQEVTILFSDVRDFTTISEALGPQETVRMLNDYFGVMVDIISDHQGILDKFIGDAIMAVFGAPYPGPDDAKNAVNTAVEMLRALDRLNVARADRCEPEISIGIGLNTGEVLSGNIGSERRMDYTVIGDGVNLAARLESITKRYGAPLLVSEFTAAGVGAQHTLREVDRMRVKGKLEPVRAFEITTHKLERHPSLSDAFADYEEGLSRYQRGDWSGACAFFERAAHHEVPDLLSAHYAERCRHLIETPPPADWDGVWVMKSKS